MVHPLGTTQHTPGFHIKKVNGKYTAKCDNCDKVLSNTARSRLLAHRTVCSQSLSSTETLVRDDDREKSGVGLGKYRSRRCFSAPNTDVDDNEFDEDDPDDHNDDPNDPPYIPVFSSDVEMDVVFDHHGNLILSSLNDGVSTGIVMEEMPEFLCNPSSSIRRSTSTPAILALSSLPVFSIFNKTSSTTASSSTQSLLSSGLSTNITTSSSSTSTPECSRKKPSTKRSSPMQRYVDTISKQEINSITMKLGNLFFGCNIPFSIVDSRFFKEYTAALCPAYLQHIPSRKKLSTSILDQAYKENLSRTKFLNEEDCVLLIDGWKNSSANLQTVVTMIKSGPKCALLEAFNATGILETGDYLQQVVDDAIALGKNRYNAIIYAVVTDNAANMLKMGRQVEIWNTNCGSHTGNLLAKDLVDQNLKKKVGTIINEFKKADLESQLLKRGGTRLRLIAETRWCSHRDAYERILKNLFHLQEVARESDIKRDVKKMLFDDDFLDALKSQVELLNPVCNVINLCQSNEASIADSAYSWLKLKLPAPFCDDERVAQTLESRRAMALNVYALAALYFHPKFANEASELINDRMPVLQDFLIENLDAEGIISLNEYSGRTGIFAKLFRKELHNGIAFWAAAQYHHSSLSRLATRLLKIPASTANIERLFSQWSVVHDPLRNSLTFKRSKKLTHLYHSLRLEDHDVITGVNDEEEA